jgi:ABC-2 type transport system ATP-binding protein
MAERHCSRIGILHQGVLVATGTLDELRTATASNGSLEELFLELTGDTAPSGNRPIRVA